MSTPKHFLDLHAIEKAELSGILSGAVSRKENRSGLPAGTVDADKPLDGRVLAMIFEKSSTRTRVSFDMAMRQLGGQTIVLNSEDMQLGRGESVADTARVLSRFVDGIMIRTKGHDVLMELAQHATIPVINGLTDDSHPCQLMADIMTFEEHHGQIHNRVVAWTGDGNNMAKTWVHAAVSFDFELRLACPEQLQVPADVIDWANDNGGRIKVVDDAYQAVDGADCVVTDTWVSMGDEAGDRHNLLKPYQVNASLMAAAPSNAIFMHCLPAHRGEEVTEDVIDGPQSVVFDEAENRLHVQKGILAWAMS